MASSQNKLNLVKKSSNKEIITPSSTITQTIQKKENYIKYSNYLLVLSNNSFSKQYEKVKSNISRIEDNYLRLFSTELDFLNRCYTDSEKKIILI